MAAGKLSPSTLGEYKTVSKVLSKAGVSHTPIRCLTPSHFIDVLCVLEDSGRRLRISEASSLPIRAVDSKRMLLRIVGKRNKERVVPLSESTLEMLRQVWKLHRSKKRLLESASRFKKPYLF